MSTNKQLSFWPILTFSQTFIIEPSLSIQYQEMPSYFRVYLTKKAHIKSNTNWIRWTVLKHIFDISSLHRDFTKLSRLITNIKEHHAKHTATSSNIVSSDDVLDVVRPFCADVAVSTDVKSHVLRLLGNAIEMAERDVSLLLFYQSQSVIGPAWQIEVKWFSTC